jgi:Tuberculosis necrotizing toxin
MGIELPAELADVAAAAGVRWPQADEDAMRTSATAWRQAGTATSALAADADGTANQALSAVQGTAGNAAQQHWHTFVAPDTGHLTSTAKGCLDAADRLDHAADQVGAAKVQIVRHLVNLAKNTDAANQAAGAGHPTALAGLTTAVHGTAVNVAQVNHTLTNSIRLDNTPPPTVSGPTHTVLGPVDHAVGAVATPVDQLVRPAAPGLLNQPIARIPDPGLAAPLHSGNPVGPANSGPLLGHTPVDHGIQPTVDHGVQPPVDHGIQPPQGATVAQSVAPVAPPPPVASVADPSDLPAASPPPQAAFAPATPLADSPAPALAAIPTSGPPPTATPSPTGGPSPIAAPAPTNSPTPTSAPPNSPAPTISPPSSPAPTSGPAPARSPASAGAARGDLISPVATPPLDPAQRRSAAVPSQPADAALPNVNVSRPTKRDDLALFLVYLFPIGQLPTATSRPSRQLPPPPPDTDFAAGLRFPPHDHPDSHLIDDSHMPADATTHPGRTADELAEGHDPLGGEHERDWDRRFLVRPATEDANAEYAWPPGELFPEGGCADGEPIVLPEGTLIDRFGTPEGRVFSADGTPFACRSLPPDHLAAGYHRYRVTVDLPVWRTLSAPWFGQPGGGERYRAVYPAADLIALGYLVEMTDDGC